MFKIYIVLSVALLTLWLDIGTATGGSGLQHEYTHDDHICAVLSANVVNFTIVDNNQYVEITLLVEGVGLTKDVMVRTTSAFKGRGSLCFTDQQYKYADSQRNSFKILQANGTRMYLTNKLKIDENVVEGKLFLCLNRPRLSTRNLSHGRWVHQGDFGWIVWPVPPMYLFRTYVYEVPEPASESNSFETTTSDYGKKYKHRGNKLHFLNDTAWSYTKMNRTNTLVTANGLRCEFLVKAVKKPNVLDDYSKSEPSNLQRETVYLCEH
ncbi:uncharacterized protein LOC126845203 [Adelges cooleyi]|uniref:uncharacterized protein LOC126845203 n=1 Tax=Adelges cooleyi TaxID=133065 RepID=UPI00218014BA|nr:uncharacterized protein LOC126845203 [Adelges cooleyi]